MTRAARRRLDVKRCGPLILIGLGLIALVALLVILSGVISIKASSGHWRITAWLLDFTKRRSVATRSIGITAPPLDDPALVMRGAGHYETGCRRCHGSPGEPMPVIPSRMTPPPPDLSVMVDRWKARELFYIVTHGIKFTGMPAWPAPGRDDEVWAVVAFLRRLPRLDEQGYARLVFGTTPPPSSLRVAEIAGARCARCHGVDGTGRETAAFPRLAGQKAEYLQRTLRAYALGARQSGMMAPVAADLDEDAIRTVSEYYAALPAAERQTTARRGSPGERIASQGIPEQDVPPCAECHGPTPRPRNAAYPTHAGQFSDYMELQLRLFAEDRRGGSEYAPIMRDIAVRLTATQRRDVAEYYATLPPSPDEIVP